MITQQDIVIALSWSGETTELGDLISFAKRQVVRAGFLDERQRQQDVGGLAERAVGVRGHADHPSEASHGDLGMITQQDIVIALSWSGETTELGDLISRRGERRGDLAADMAALADARHDHPARDVVDRRDGGAEPGSPRRSPRRARRPRSSIRARPATATSA
jgi:hypothetical protein